MDTVWLVLALVFLVWGWWRLVKYLFDIEPKKEKKHTVEEAKNEPVPVDTVLLELYADENIREAGLIPVRKKNGRIALEKAA